MELDEQCKKILELLNLNDKNQKAELMHQTHNFSRKFDNPKEVSVSDINKLIELEYEVMPIKGYTKERVENVLFNTLLTITFYDYSKTNSLFKKSEIEDIMSLFTKLAKKVFAFKDKRVYSNTRKALVLDLFGSLLHKCDLAEAFEFAIAAITSKNDTVIIAGLSLINEHFDLFENKVTNEFIELLDNIILKTKSRSVAFNALDIQVSNCNISELEALDRLDKEDANYF